VAGKGDVTPEERLISDLLENYTKEARPVKNPKDRIVVVFGFELVQLVNVVSRNMKNIWRLIFSDNGSVFT